MQLPFRWLSPTPSSPDSQPRLLAGGAVLPPGSRLPRRKAWLLSRALYRCRSLPLEHVAVGERRAALRNLLLAWAPFDRSEYRVALRGPTALAFAWDRAAVREQLAKAAASADDDVWPESLLREPPAADGLRLLRGLEGVEAQLWRDGDLIGSRWWPAAPDDEALAIWLRSMGPAAVGVEVASQVAAVAWRRRPSVELLGLDDLLSTTTRLERLTVGCALVGLALTSGLQGHQAWAAYQAREAVREELEAARRDAAPVLAARDRAQALARELEFLTQQMNGVLPVELLQHLSDVLPERGVTLKELELAGARLRLSLELAPEVQRGALVQDLQAAGWLTQVVQSRGAESRGWVSFDSELDGTRAPILPPRAARQKASSP